MTNDAQLARALADQCDGGSGEWTREASPAGGLDQIGTIFPSNLVTSVLKVIKRKMLDQRVISAVELESGGPTAELPELWNQPDYQEYWDDVNGGFLDPRLKHGFWSSIGSRRNEFLTTVPGQKPRRRVSNPFL